MNKIVCPLDPAVANDNYIVTVPFFIFKYAFLLVWRAYTAQEKSQLHWNRKGGGERDRETYSSWQKSGK